MGQLVEHFGRQKLSDAQKSGPRSADRARGYQAMRGSKLQDATVAQLVERFTAIGVEQDKALLRRAHAKFNRLFDEMVAIEDELKARTGDQRRELLGLYGHPNAQVRLNAMKATLALAPEPAHQALRALADSREYPQAGDSGMTLIALERGIFKPT